MTFLCPTKPLSVWRSALPAIVVLFVAYTQTGCFGLTGSTPSSNQTTPENAPTGVEPLPDFESESAVENTSDSEEARRKEKEDFESAAQENTVEAYHRFAEQYPDSVFRFEVRKRIGDIEWEAVVTEGTENELNAYVAQYPDGYYRARADLLLKSIAYYAENQEEVDQKKSVIKAAQKAVDQSPLTNAWEPFIIDYVDGNIFFNLNDGPTSQGGTGYAALQIAEKQGNAYQSTCELLKRKVTGVETCLTAWKQTHARAKDSIPASYATIKAIQMFYVRAIEKKTDFYPGRLLELLDTLLNHREKYDSLFYTGDNPRLFAAKIFAILGLENQALTALHEYSNEQKSAYFLDAGFIEGYFRDLSDNEEYQAILREFGGMTESQKERFRERLRQGIK